eukprot:jgi/Psemu1/284425/fgenesh1_pg.53_\
MKRVISLRAVLNLVIGTVVFSVVYGNDNSGGDEEVRVPVIDLSPWFDRPIVSPSSSSSEPEPQSRHGGTVNATDSLNEEQRAIVQQVRRACREVGFFQITGVLGGSDDDDTIQRTWRVSREFFDLSIEEKLLHRTTDNAEYPYGYERSETLVKGKLLDGEDDASAVQAEADLKETFAVGPPTGNGSGMPPRRWIDSPNASPDFQPSLEAYYQRMEELALVLLEIFAIALEEPPDFFEDKMDHHMSALRLVHYYPLETEPPKNKSTESASYEAGSNEQPTRRLVRAGAHTDYGALTILAAHDEGLEVLLRDTAEATTERSVKHWHPVPLVPGAFVVNLGDLMQRWTNHEWVSTMHRVVMPATEARERRYSMAYFVNINGDTPILPLRCCLGPGESPDCGANGDRVMTAGEHLMAKHLASMGIKTETTDSGNARVSRSSGEGEL